MVDTGILCSGTQVTYKVGANPNSTAVSEALLNDFIQQAEARLNTDTEYNWNDAYSALNSDVQGIINEAVSNLAAIYAINYDPNAWPLATATFKINVLYTGYKDCVNLLNKIDKGQSFVQDA